MCDKRLRPPQDLSAHDRMQWRGLPCPIPRSDRSLSKPRALSAEPEPSRPRATESSDDDANGAQLLRQPQLIDHSDDDEGCAFQCHRCHRRCANRTQLSGGGAVSSRPKAEAQAALDVQRCIARTSGVVYGKGAGASTQSSGTQTSCRSRRWPFGSQEATCKRPASGQLLIVTYACRAIVTYACLSWAEGAILR